MTLNINNDFRSVVDAEADKFDRSSRAVTVITEEHRLTHEGFVYHCSGRTAGISNNDNLDILFNVPAFTYPHLRKTIFALSDTPGIIALYEGTTTTDDGTVLPNYNRNRNSANLSSTVVTEAPTITDVGTLIHDRLIGDTGGLGANEIGAESPGLGEEWMLQPSTNYLLRVTNASGGTVTIAYELMWYEIKWQNAGK